MRGGEGNDVIRTGSAPDGLVNSNGTPAPDGIIDGGPGNDIIIAGPSEDRLAGGEGDDLLFGGLNGTVPDTYDCGPGNDYAFVENPDEAVIARSSQSCENIVVGDPSANDVRFDGLGATPHPGKTTGGAEGAAILEAIALQGELPVILGLPGDDNFVGTVVADSINGQDGNDTIRGGAGDDEIRGDDGNDALFGELGNDLLFGDQGNDVVDGGPGDDELDGGRGNDTLRGGDGDDAISGGFDADTVDGGGGNDDIRVVSGGTDTVDCGPGFDRVTKDRFDKVRNCESIG